MQRFAGIAFICFGLVLACGDRNEPAKTASTPPPQTSASASASAPAVMDSGTTSTSTADASVADAAPPAPPPPAKVTRSGKTWPFHSWTRAEAFTFNQFPMRPRTPMVVYDDTTGWSPHIVDRKPLDQAKAKQSVDLVMATNGDVEVSKCPFPRHAVVLYDGDAPVASINVCFSCGDIVLWPLWEPAPDWGKLTDKQTKEIMDRHQKQMKLYEKTFPKWKSFFKTDVGFAIDDTFH